MKKPGADEPAGQEAGLLAFTLRGKGSTRSALRRTCKPRAGALASRTCQKQGWIIKRAGVMKSRIHIPAGQPDIVQHPVVKIADPVGRQTISEGTPRGLDTDHPHQATGRGKARPLYELEFCSALDRAHRTILSSGTRSAVPSAEVRRKGCLGDAPGRRRLSMVICDHVIAENLLISPTNVSND